MISMLESYPLIVKFLPQRRTQTLPRSELGCFAVRAKCCNFLKFISYNNWVVGNATVL